MNENLNLIAILKDCPKGTKLYSTVLGEVELDYVLNGNLDEFVDALITADRAAKLAEQGTV